MSIEISPEFLQKVSCDTRNVDVGIPVIGHFDPLCTAVGRQVELELASGLANELLAECAVLLGLSRGIDTSNSEKLSQRELASVLDSIDAKLQDDVSLCDLADELGMTLPRFARAFKNSTGQSPYKFILDRRINRASLLLRETGMPIVDVALTLGFSSQSHLTTQFKKTFGVTPARYRSQRVR